MNGAGARHAGFGRGLAPVTGCARSASERRREYAEVACEGHSKRRRDVAIVARSPHAPTALGAGDTTRMPSRHVGGSRWILNPPVT
jgi:hypothetical protein